MIGAALVLSAVGLSAWLLQPAVSATCVSLGLDPQRTWHFENRGTTWRVSHWRGTRPKDAVGVTLPTATRVQLSGQSVDVKGRTSNGGIDVSLSGPPQSAQLDIYVSYELEVNVDTSLTPAIDELNTDGPTGVSCEVQGA